MRKLRQEVNVPLAAVPYNVGEIKQKYYRHKEEALVKKL